MLSSIWVATITGLPAARQARRIRRWIVGTFSGAISTPRSPRATITASERATISSSRSTAAGFSSLATSETGRPASARTSSRSSGRCTNDSATQSTPSGTAKARSTRSFSVRAETGSTAPTTLTPLRSDSAPADQHPGGGALRAGRLDLEPDLAVVDQQLHARCQRREDLGVRQRHPLGAARRRVEVEPHPIADGERQRPSGQPADAQLGALQVRQDADRPADLCSMTGSCRSARGARRGCHG